MTGKKSFFRTMLEEKGLEDQIIQVQHKKVHFVEMGFLIELIESVGTTEQYTIEKTMRRIDFGNGDMMHYMTHLATGYIEQNY